MPRSKKPSLRPRQGLVSVCNALDRVISWEACPAGVSELLRDQIHFTIRCGMRRQEQRQAGPPPSAGGKEQSLDCHPNSHSGVMFLGKVRKTPFLLS